MIRRLMYGAAMTVASMVIGACGKDSPTSTGASSVTSDDYALVVFGTSGDALQSTLGPQGPHPFDGGSGAPPFPDSLALTAAQTAAIAALRTAFETAHQPQLDSLHSIFEAARAAHDAGEPRDSIRAILESGRAIGQALQTAVDALHQSILAVFTDAQRAWMESHRPPPPPDMDGRPRPGPPRDGRGGPPPG